MFWHLLQMVSILKTSHYQQDRRCSVFFSRTRLDPLFIVLLQTCTFLYLPLQICFIRENILFQYLFTEQCSLVRNHPLLLNVKVIRHQCWCTRCAYRQIMSLQWFSGRKIWKSVMLLLLNLVENKTECLEMEPYQSKDRAMLVRDNPYLWF
jgi:hypothetical protein